MTVPLPGEDDYTWYRAAELEHNPFLWLFAKGEEKKKKKKAFLLIKWAHLVSLRASNPAACKWHFYWVTFHSRTPLAVYYWGCKHLSQHSYLVNIATSQGRGLLMLSSMPQGKLLDHTLSSSSVPSEGDRRAHNSLGWRKPLYGPGPAFTGQVLQQGAAFFHAGGFTDSETCTWGHRTGSWICRKEEMWLCGCFWKKTMSQRDIIASEP